MSISPGNRNIPSMWWGGQLLLGSAESRGSVTGNTVTETEKTTGKCFVPKELY